MGSYLRSSPIPKKNTYFTLIWRDDVSERRRDLEDDVVAAVVVVAVVAQHLQVDHRQVDEPEGLQEPDNFGVERQAEVWSEKRSFGFTINRNLVNISGSKWGYLCLLYQFVGGSTGRGCSLLRFECEGKIIGG